MDSNPELDRRSYLVCEKCHKYTTSFHRLSGHIESSALQEIDPEDGWRRFKSIPCPTCQRPLILFQPSTEGT